ASVEQRDNPALRDKPVVVGGRPTSRGVVCAASYEARKFGVRSAMPSVTAGRLCPQAIFIPPRMDFYIAESRQIMKILAETGATEDPMLIDEVYLDVSNVIAGPELVEKAAQPGRTESPRLVPELAADAALYSAVPLGRALKQSILEQRHLTATIGIAANKF